MKKKVMYLLEYPLDLPGGAQMSTESLCQGLTGTEFEPVVVCPELLKNNVDYPFRILTYPMGEKRIPNLLKRLRAFLCIIRRESPEIIHCQMPESLITFGILRGIGQFRRIKLVFTDRGLFYGYRRHSMAAMKFALKRVDRMLTTTEYNRTLWEEGSRIRPITVVANTISNAFGTYEPDKRTNKGFVLGFAGRVCEEKNWPLAVELVRRVREAGIEFQIEIVMSVFEPGDMEIVKQTVDAMKETAGAENVRSHLDFNQQQMADFYYGVDVFVMTSRFESFGKAAVEAMSRKCIVVSTDVGGLPEVIGRRENLYQEEHLEKAVAYIKDLWQNSKTREADREYFYRRYQENYSQEKCLSDHLKIYRELDCGQTGLKQ